MSERPWHLWVVGVIAVLFNGIGVFDWIMNLLQGADYLASAGMTQPQIDHYIGLPLWMKAIWTIGVWSALLGSVLILMRNRRAATVFAVSLAAFLVSLLYTYVLTDGGDILGQRMAVASAFITAVLVFLMAYARVMAKRGVLHR
jgi:hypothetical protein